jgi:hypothetical protein
MHKIPTACPLRWQRKLRYRKKSFLDEPRDMIASMRRNNGDAAFIMSNDDNEVFVEWRAAMRSFPAIAEKRGIWSAGRPSPTRSRFGLLLAQAEHSEQ